MTRDDDFFRDMLMGFESSKDYIFIVAWTPEADTEEAKTEYHVQLACDAGFMLKLKPNAYRLTSQGHDYLDAVRSDTVWKKTKEGAAKVGGMTLSMMKDLAVAYVKQEAANKLGIEL